MEKKYYSKLLLKFILFTFKDVVQPVFHIDIEENGDLFLDVAEAYMDIRCNEEAKTILEQLVKSEAYSLVSEE